VTPHRRAARRGFLSEALVRYRPAVEVRHAGLDGGRRDRSEARSFPDAAARPRRRAQIAGSAVAGILIRHSP
jgi:hypothetical protein